MSRSVAVAAVLAFFAVAILTACGSSDSGGSSTQERAATTNSATAAPAASTTGQSAPDQTTTVVARCHKVFDPILVQLHQIGHITDGTPQLATYRAATNKLLATYSAFDVNSVPDKSCLKAVSIPTTSAYLLHLNAANTWTECHKRNDCAKVMPQIKALWSKASKLVDTGAKGFDKITSG